MFNTFQGSDHQNWSRLQLFPSRPRGVGPRPLLLHELSNRVHDGVVPAGEDLSSTFLRIHSKTALSMVMDAVLRTKPTPFHSNQ